MRMSKRMLCATAALLAPAVGVHAAPLTVVTVGAPAVNCVFNPTCKVTVTDSVGTIPLPGATGAADLQSRTYKGVRGTKGQGLTAYVYRVDLTQAVGVVAAPCVVSLALDFGPVTKLAYAGPLADVFVVTSGGLGTIGIGSADKVGNVITFTFASPVCSGSSPGKGDTSYFFGLAAKTAPKSITAQVQRAPGGAVGVPARVPIH